MTMTDAEKIAVGVQPSWTHTFNHPRHGELTFSVKALPTAMRYLEIATAQEQIAPGVNGGQGALLAEAIAGISVLMERPVIAEERIVDPDTPGHERIVKTFYDPAGDVVVEFPLVVWGAFVVWRNQVLSEDTQEQVKNSSGATDTTSSVSDAPSPDTTTSLPSIAA